MNIQFYAKNIELTAGLREAFKKKLNHLKKYKGKLRLLDVRVDLSRDRHHKKGDVFRVEVNVDLPDKVLRVAEAGANMLSTLDMVSKKLERQARDEKDIIVSKKKINIS